MIVNLVVIFLMLILGGIYSQGTATKRNGAANRKAYIKVVSIILILQSGLRNIAVGSDTYAYFIRFEDMKITSWNEIFQFFINYYIQGIGKDPGYRIFEKFFQVILHEYQLYLIIIAILFFTALGRFIYFNTSKLNHAILAYILYSVLFYSFFSVTGHRQTIATAIALLGYELAKRRKLISFVVIVFMASSMHKSALIVLPLYFLIKYKNSKFLYCLVLVSFPILMILKEKILIMMKILVGYDNYDVYQGAGTFTFTMMYLFISLGVLYRMDFVLKLYPKAIFYYNVMAIGVLFLPLTWVNPTAMRVVMYFSIFMLVLIPIVVESFQQYSEKTQKAVMFLAISTLILLFLQSSANVEYKFFWQEMSLGSNYN